MYSEPVLNSSNVYVKLKQTSKYYQVKNLMLDLLSPAVIPLLLVLLFVKALILLPKLHLGFLENPLVHNILQYLP